MRSVCVFCGSSPGSDPRYAAQADALARELAARGIGVVFGGGSVGLMGVLADHALAAGGHVTGVIPHGLAARELAHRGVADMRVVPTMHARKALMADPAAAALRAAGSSTRSRRATAAAGCGAGTRCTSCRSWPSCSGDCPSTR